MIAYIMNGDLWVINMVSGHSRRLTNTHGENRSLSDNPLSAGVPSYVMQEEFSRYQGFWWQPKNIDGIYRILYEEVDESDVLLFKFPSSQPVGVDYEEYRFPRAGTPNAKSKLKIVQFSLSETLSIDNVCILDLQSPLTYYFPWLEYIVRINWMPDGKNVWAQLLNRQQNRLELIVIPLDNFCDVCSNSTVASSSSASESSIVEHSWQSSLAKEISPIQVICSQTSSTWINVHDLLEFIEITNTHITFVWASEETGFRHLYLVTAMLENAIEVQPNGTRSNALQPRIISKVPLTSGEWEVLGRNIWIDRQRNLIYFMGLRESPLEKHLYVVHMHQPNQIRLLTKPGFSYTIEFNEDCSILVQVFCNIHNLPSCAVHQIVDVNGAQKNSIESIRLRSIGFLFEGGIPACLQMRKYNPTIHSRRLLDGEQLYAMVFKPHNYRPGERYPTVLNVYGGPEVQTVSNTYKVGSFQTLLSQTPCRGVKIIKNNKISNSRFNFIPQGMRQLRMHMLAGAGYCVVCIDSRGSRHRGHKFESHLFRRMGSVELADQVEMLHLLCEELDFIDMDRIAIHGWSYGGYLSLMGLIQFPQVFKLAISGAPVTNWEMYDTGYTERYMDLPAENEQGYADGSVLTHINEFPDE